MLLYLVVKNHSFIDGNKRIGALALLVMLDLNHIEIIMSSKELEDAMDALISGVSSAQAWDNDIMSIIQEESAGFFAGQRTVDDVCKNIQKRATLVVQER